MEIYAATIGPTADRLRIIRRSDCISLEFSEFSDKGHYKSQVIEIGNIDDLVAIRNTCSTAIHEIRKSERSMG